MTHPARRLLAWLTLSLSLAVLVVLPTPAGAHTELESSVPEDGAAVADPPSELVLTFTTAVADAESAQVSVTDPAGDDLVAADPVISEDLTRVTVPLNQAVLPGDHTVEWAVVAEDDHLISGTLTFTLAPPEEVLTPLPPTDGPVVEPAQEATEPVTEEPADAVSPPEPTPQPETTAGDEPEPTPRDDASAQPTELATDLTASDEGSPLVGIVLGGLALLGVAAVLVLRVRNSGPLGDGDQDS